MVKYLLKFSRFPLKNKQVFSLFLNYYLFAEVFNYIFNCPQYVLLKLSLQQMKLTKIKSFMFCKLKLFNFKKNLNILGLKKNTINNFVLIQLFTVLIYCLFIKIFHLIFIQLLSFIPFTFRSLNVFNKIHGVNCDKRLCYTISIDAHFSSSTVIKNVIKLLKKFLNDNDFIETYLWLMYNLKLKKNIIKIPIHFSFILDNILLQLYFSQTEYFFSFITLKFIINFTHKLQIYYQSIFFLFNKLLNKHKCLKTFFDNSKSCVFYKKKKLQNNLNYFSYLRINYTILLLFSSSFYVFCWFKKYILKFIYILFHYKKRVNQGFVTGGYQILINRLLKKQKNFLVTLAVPLKNLKKHFVHLQLLNFKIQPITYSKAIFFLNINIINWYFSFFLGFINYYKGCHNFKKFILKLYYVIKWSILYSFAKKHKKSIKIILNKYFTRWFSSFEILFKFYLKRRSVNFNFQKSLFFSYTYLYAL